MWRILHLTLSPKSKVDAECDGDGLVETLSSSLLFTCTRADVASPELLQMFSLLQSPAGPGKALWIIICRNYNKFDLYWRLKSSHKNQ